MPQTMFSAPPSTPPSSPPDVVVPHTILSVSLAAVPQTMLSPLSPRVLAMPQTMFKPHAFALGLMSPFLSRWLPQMIERLHVLGA